jgi:hypothetical protein
MTSAMVGRGWESSRRLRRAADPEGTSVQIPKDQILDLIRSRGDDAQAQQASQELPDQVDPEQHSGLLSKFGIDPQDLISKFMGGGGGGLGGLLGG